MPQTWKVKAVDIPIEDLRAGIELPVDVEPIGIMLRGQNPVIICKQLSSSTP